MTNKLTLKTAIRTALMGSALLAGSPTAFAGEEIPQHERRPFFGELHIHTNYSLDSYIKYNENDPHAAYQFARGKKIPIGATKEEAEVFDRISRPLDFAAVTDHAETMGEYVVCLKENSDAESCQDLRDHDPDIFLEIHAKKIMVPPQRQKDVCGENPQPWHDPRDDEALICRKKTKGLWKDIQNIAEQYNDPGKFTTFIAYEYSLNPSDSSTLHRNLIFKDTNVTAEALSAYELQSPSQLWAWLEDSCKEEDGCDVIAIPHNFNLDWGGHAFGPEDPQGNLYTQEDYRRRAKFEKLIEIHQIKGNSECSIGAGTSDEFCNFELIVPPCQPGQTNGKCTPYASYVRNGLKRGLQLAGEINAIPTVVEKLNERFPLDKAKKVLPEKLVKGVNPFKYGIIGATDNHNSAAGGTEEYRFTGASGKKNSTPKNRLSSTKKDGLSGRNQNPGGLAGVWAEENTRESIFEALKRKETFGTSGTRLKVRLFGGWNYRDELHDKPDMIKQAYDNGVPMGGDLTNAPLQTAPKFLVWAQKDPLRFSLPIDFQKRHAFKNRWKPSNLDRIQIVKGWEDVDGTNEKTYDIVCSDGREPAKWNDRCPDNGATVDLDYQSKKFCQPDQKKGARELRTVWEDPDFEPSHRAFYYVRVLENPSCRWSTYDAKALYDAGEFEQKLIEGLPPTIQERAWTSPIWYTPGEMTQTTLQEALAAGGVVTLTQLEAANVSPLDTKKLIAMTVGKTLTHKDLRDDSEYDIFYTTKNQRIVSQGVDQIASTYYTIGENRRYEATAQGDVIPISIYRVNDDAGKSRDIVCDPRDNGYCNWEILPHEQPMKQ
ncbi:MAG: hypothetical protein DRR19_16670 [Candidatus Parabeggiatoa sp. nov. 1]|nr:MAG: hypothetical protein DRR19_16670 [Gammaproteobacteria bacterium]